MTNKKDAGQRTTRGEQHGCIVCGRLYEVYSVYDAKGKFIDCKVMSAGGKRVPDPDRALVACERHTDAEVKSALIRVFGKQTDGEE